MTKEEALSLEKIITKIDKADETNCKKEEEYNSFCTNTREDWDEEKYQKLKREKALTEAAYFYEQYQADTCLLPLFHAKSPEY